MNARLLLFDPLASNYQRLQQLVTAIGDHYELIWLQHFSVCVCQTCLYDICLLDESLIAENYNWLETLAPHPVIVLTDNQEKGKQALEAGAVDYLNLKTLTVNELERSLRLTQKIAQLTQTKNHQPAKTALEQSATGMFVVSVSPRSRQLTFSAANHVYQSWASPNQKITSGSSITASLLEPIANNLIEYCHLCLDSAQTVLYEQPIYSSQQIWQISIIPTVTAEGQIQQLQGIAIDVTHLKDRITTEHRYLDLLRTISLKITQSESIEAIFPMITAAIQNILKTDRVTIFQYLVDGSALAIADFVDPAYPSMLNQQFQDYLYYEQLHHQSKKHYSYVCNDVEQVDFSPHCRQFISQFQIKSYSMVPIYLRSPSVIDTNRSTSLWGLIGVQQCRQTRTWTNQELWLLHQITKQISIALAQNRLLELETAQKQELADSNARLEQFAYVASHDLQSPLQLISNYAQLLQSCQNDLESSANRYINHIYNESTRMQQHIQALFAYARIGHNQEALSSTNLNLVIEKAIGYLTPLLQNQQGIVTVNNQLPTLEVYENLIVILFQNLINNGIKYNQQATPTVTIAAKPLNNSWLFSVKDNGIGIDPKYNERVFQIFQRLHRNQEYEGTGIGLAICRRIVELHQGRIWINSQLQLGTTVYFTLPAKVDFLA